MVKIISGSKKAVIATVIIVSLWILTVIIDFARIHSFERPIFCILLAEYAKDDGGSGTYVGLGYSFDIKGNFLPEDELYGVTEYNAKLFSIPVMMGVRD